MPSVGMRRSTRVFVPKSIVKDDGARVLRSGKRLWSESEKPKLGRGSEGDEWFRLLDNSGDADDVACCKDNGWREVVQSSGATAMALSGDMGPVESVGAVSAVPIVDESVDRMYGVVYYRKRRRLDMGRAEKLSGDRMYGISFVRKQRRKRSKVSLTGSSRLSHNSTKYVLAGNLAPHVHSRQVSSLDGFLRQGLLLVVVDSSCSNSRQFACFLYSLLSYMMRARLGLSRVAAFMCLKPIATVFSRRGIHFLHALYGRNGWNNGLSSFGLCKIFGAQQFIPLFSVDFSAIPFPFMSLHSKMFLRSAYLPDVLLQYVMHFCTNPRRFIEEKKSHSFNRAEIDLDTSKIVDPKNTSTQRSEVDPIVRAPVSSCRSVSSRYRVSNRVAHKRRSSLRARAKNSSLVDLHDSSSGVGADLLSIRDDYTSLSSPMYSRKQRRPLGENIKELKSTLEEVRQNMDSIVCSANVLVIESDKCYRHEGAKVTLECSTPNKWLLVVKTQGSLRYFHKAQKVMRPSTSNRFTQAMIWAGENGWKLEFSDRRDWFIFKELYKECYDRNVQAGSVKTIPVPGVLEVEGYEDDKYVPFVRGDTYITTDDLEVTRALTKKVPNYDIESDDEKWLNELNRDFCDGEDGSTDCISVENFEKIVDAFEKAAYCSPDDISDENKNVDLCSSLGRRDMLARVHDYWLKKRKQRRSALLRVFQFQSPRRAQVVPKPLIRKKRSFKRQASKQFGRGKQPSYLQALAAEHDTMAAIRRVHEAEGSARRSLEVAVAKRQKAQMLMDIADLAVYKATVALKIADTARIAEPQDAAVSSFLG
ncbi:PREDICTED: uncharacterized protein LOC104587561 [Nelumbo nucifera]|uniref:Enhancer of polycomb-like protein n=1 Tax=Nelumbo nucifera TaxID=4432 RepID=A0A1U7YZA8_NELNU|nr:PREDICTED: uncharacterized protein LOC104587561 [Nelumbo nucifera]